MSSYRISKDPYKREGDRRRKPCECFNCGETGHYTRECNQPNYKRIRREENYSKSSRSDDRKRQRREGSYSRRRSRTKSPFQDKENGKHGRYERRRSPNQWRRGFRRSRSRSYGFDSQYSSSTTSSTHGDSPRYDKDHSTNIYRSERKCVDPRRRAYGLYNKYFSADGRYLNSSVHQSQRQYDPVYNHSIEYSRPNKSDERDQELNSVKFTQSANICNEEESWDDDPPIPLLNCNDESQTISKEADLKQLYDTEESWD